MPHSEKQSAWLPPLQWIGFAVIFMAGLSCGGTNDFSSPFGICAHITTDEFPNHRRAIELISNLNCRWVRADFNLRHIHPTPDIWEFRRTDSVIAEASSSNVTILPILTAIDSLVNPAWQLPEKWNRYVRGVVTRYQKELRAWELWTEPDNGFFWPDPEPAHYLILLKNTHRTIKEIDPALQIIIGGFSDVPEAFITKLYENGARDYFDVMNFHVALPPQPEPAIEDRVNLLRNLMSRFNDGDKPIWMTEVGCPSIKPEQHAYLIRAYLTALRCGVQRVFWYELVDAGNDPQIHRSQNGVLRSDFTPKPAYTAYQTLTENLPAGSQFTPAEWYLHDRSIYFPQWVRADRTPGGALWAQEQGHYTLKTKGGQITFFTFDGTPVQPLKAENGSFTVALSSTPIFFRDAALLSIHHSE